MNAEQYYRQSHVWQSQNKNQTKTKNIKASYPNANITAMQILYSLKMRRCELCRYNNNFKYVRTDSMIRQGNNCMVFVICDSCFGKPQSQLPCKIQKQSYMPMTDYYYEISTLIDSSLGERDYKYLQFDAYAKYEQKLSHTINQISKALQKYKKLICNGFKEQLVILKNFHSRRTFEQLIDVLSIQDKCCCLTNCCYCDYELSNNNDQRQNCPYYCKKIAENQFISKIHLKNIINTNFTNQKQYQFIEAVINELEITIMNYIGPIQQAIKHIAQETSHFQFDNEQFRNQMADKYATFQSENSKIQYFQTIVAEYKQKYIHTGIINSFTIDIPDVVANESPLYCSLQLMLNEEQIRSSLKYFNSINKLTVVSGSIGDLIAKDANWLCSELVTSKQIIPSQLINLSSFANLKVVEWNSRIDLSVLSQLSSMLVLQKIYIGCDQNCSVERRNQSYHFLQQNAIKSIGLDQMQNMLSLHNKKIIKNISIRDCDEFQLKMLQNQLSLQNMDYIQSVSIGSQNQEQQLPPMLHCLSNLKQLIFNKIVFNQHSLSVLISKNNQLKAIQLNECSPLSEQNMQQLSKLCNLKKLVFIRMNSISFPEHSPSLQVFILQRYYLKINKFLYNFLQSSKLVYLNLYECLFINDSFMTTLLDRLKCNNSKLRSVNLGYTNITNATILKLNMFESLECLHVGGTNVDLLVFMQDLKTGSLLNINKLQKLSLKEMNQIKNKLANNILPHTVSQYYNDIFSNILSQFPALTHLDISQNIVINQRAIRYNLTYLTYLTITNTLFQTNQYNDTTKGHSGSHCPFSNGRLILKKYRSEELQQNKSQDVEERVGEFGQFEVKKKKWDSFIRYIN